MKILIINTGSSSVKYALIEAGTGHTLAEGIVERIGLEGARHKGAGRGGEFQKSVDAPNHRMAMELVLTSLADAREGGLTDISEIDAVGHRVVHGGEKFKNSVLIDNEVKEAIRSLFPLAPLHNPPNLAGIEACQELLHVPQIAVFDTAFHASIPPVAYTYPLPRELYEKHAIRRYGFHGTSHRFVSRRAVQMLGKGPEGTRIVTCHIGNGCSVTAVKDGISVDTSMGFTPLEGVMMGTRSGSIDPAIPLFLIQHGMEADDVDDLLNKKSGILGLSGIGSSDFRDLLAAVEKGDERARLAFEVYCYRVRFYIGAFAATLGGLDAVVFTAGIGENSPEFRTKTCEGLEFLGIQVDEEKNRNGKGDRDISSSSATCTVFIVHTHEDLVIVEETVNLISGN